MLGGQNRHRGRAVASRDLSGITCTEDVDRGTDWRAQVRRSRKDPSGVTFTRQSEARLGMAFEDAREHSDREIGALALIGQGCREQHSRRTCAWLEIRRSEEHTSELQSRQYL